MKVAVIGATGVVGRKMIKVLEEHNFPLTRIYAVASEKSIGEKIPYKQSEIEVITPEKALRLIPDIALFSAGAAVSATWAPKFAKAGTTVIDNSSAWRMDPEIPLVIPEINGNILKTSHKIIANPNCSTIQMLMAITPLHRKFGIKRIVVSTYQSVSGSGKMGIEQLMNERQHKSGKKVYPYPIDMNVLPHAGDFTDSGYTTEEEKLANETRKILRDEAILISATAARVPVTGGHSESINLELRKAWTMEEVIFLLNEMPGLVVQDDLKNNIYPMPVSAQGKDDVFVGRIRRDNSVKNGLNLWVVADNLRKGAATNAVQIAEYLIKQKLLG